MPIDKAKLTKLSQIHPIRVIPYENYMANFENQDVVSKINSMIQTLLQMGKLTNQTVSQWNMVMEWIINGGMDEIAIEIVNEKIAIAIIEMMRLLDISLENGLKELAKEVTAEKIAELVTTGEFNKMVSEALLNINAVVEQRMATFDLQLEQAEIDITNRVVLSKTDNEGQFPKPFRVPTLVTEQSFPNVQSPYTPVWVEGKTIYAFGKDNTLRKSVDGGKNWTVRGFNSYGFGAYSCFLKTSTGILLNIEAVTKTIQRSTDDGATWTAIFTFRTNTVPLGSQSWCIDPVTGYIYMGEYFTAGTNDIVLWRSTDDGATWVKFFTFAGELTPVETPLRIRHIHSVQYDPFARRIVVSTGDSTPDTGLWRTNEIGTGLERIVTNSMLSANEIDSSRSIGIMPFKNYIAWAGDTTFNPYLFRMARTEIGKENPVIERVYKLNSASWFTCKASADGSRWVFSSSNEGSTSLDKLVHLYAVEDEGKTVWEIGSFAALNPSIVSALQPIGYAEHNDSFWMAGRNMNNYAWNFKLGRGLTSIELPALLPNSPVVQTASTGNLVLSPSTKKVFHVAQAGGLGRRLFLYEIGAGKIESDVVENGNLAVLIRKKSTGEILYRTTFTSERYAKRLELGGEITSFLLTGADILEFVVENVHAGATITTASSITYGWGAV